MLFSLVSSRSGGADEGKRGNCFCQRKIELELGLSTHSRSVFKDQPFAVFPRNVKNMPSNASRSRLPDEWSCVTKSP